mgnify:CR=1 FL=1
MTTAARLSRPPIERMLRIHEELRRGAFTNCTRLAAQLEVSRKTVVRDIAFMRDRLDLPVEFDARINAYRYTHPVSSFPTVQVSEGELLALLVARKALEQYRGTPFHRQLEASFENRETQQVRNRIARALTHDDRLGAEHGGVVRIRRGHRADSIFGHVVAAVKGEWFRCDWNGWESEVASQPHRNHSIG